MSAGNGNGNGVKTTAVKGVIELLKGQPFGNVLLAAMLVALGFGAYRGIPYMMDRMDITLDKANTKWESAVGKVTAEFREYRKEDYERTSGWIKSIGDRHEKQHAEAMKELERIETAIRGEGVSVRAGRKEDL